MGKIIASYLLKVHLHAPDAAPETDAGDATAVDVPTNDALKAAVIDGLEAVFGQGAPTELAGGIDATVSLIERTDD